MGLFNKAVEKFTPEEVNIDVTKLSLQERAERLERFFGNQVIPEHFICPITLTIMENPVVNLKGQTYERSAILAHLGRQQTCPLTRERMTAAELCPNITLRNMIAFIEKKEAKLKKLYGTITNLEPNQFQQKTVSLN